MHNQDTFVGMVAISLGLAALVGAGLPDRLVQVSRLATGIQQRAGRTGLAIASAGLGLLLIGIGISLLL